MVKSDTTSAKLADRRPTYIIDTPCLTRHYIIRTPEDPATKINSFIHKLNAQPSSRKYKRLISPLPIFDASLPIGEHDQERNAISRHVTSFGTLTLASVLTDISIEAHSEYFSIHFRAYPTTCQHSFCNEVARLLRQMSTNSFATEDDLILSNRKGDIRHADAAREKIITKTFDTFWERILNVSIAKKDTIGLSPQRYFASYKTEALVKGIVIRNAHLASLNDGKDTDHPDIIFNRLATATRRLNTIPNSSMRDLLRAKTPLPPSLIQMKAMPKTSSFCEIRNISRNSHY